MLLTIYCLSFDCSPRSFSEGGPTKSMFNPFLILYFVLLFVFLVGIIVVLYHLQAYKFNERIALFVSSLFIVCVLISLTINIVIAIGIDWEEFVIVP